jgi:hypothetical protein
MAVPKEEKAVIEAARRYADFHGREPEYIDRLLIPRAFFTIGELYEIPYGPIENGKRVVYNHEFKRPPSLAISSDGRCALILAGGWRFTSRGFEG